MIRFVLGVIVGIVVATVGFTGITQMLDHGVDQVKNQAKELTK